MTADVRTAVADRLGKSGTVSLKKDVFGIYSDDNPPTRSLLEQLDLIWPTRIWNTRDEPIGPR